MIQPSVHVIPGPKEHTMYNKICQHKHPLLMLRTSVLTACLEMGEVTFCSRCEDRE